ncbi:midasin-like protein, partial [Achlya hypogyna]
ETPAVHAHGQFASQLQLTRGCRACLSVPFRVSGCYPDKAPPIKPRGLLIGLVPIRIVTTQVQDMADLAEAVRVFTAQLDHELSPALSAKVRATLGAAPSNLVGLATILAADEPELCAIVCRHFRPFLLELSARLLSMTFDDHKHERLALTYARVLAVTSRIWPLVQPWFETATCFFHHIDSMSVARKRRAAMTGHLLTATQLDTVASMWNWAPFYALCTVDQDATVRTEAMAAAALLLRMDNLTRDAFFGTMPSSSLPAAPMPLTTRTLHQESGETLPASLCNLCGILVPYRHTNHEAVYPPLVETPSMVAALRSLAISLSLRRPLLVTGTDGAGKTALVRELAQRTGHSDLVELHLDDQMDSKTLLGSYVCTDVPGEFTWQPGALTQAVTEGRWVLIEDIDRASMDVLAALLPLLTTQELLVRGHRVPAAPGFQLLATSRKPISAMPKGFPLSLWHRVPVTPLDMAEIALVVAVQFPRLPAHVTERLLATFALVTDDSAVVWRTARQSYGRAFSLRDVLKWCRRITKLHGSIDDGQYLTQAMRDDFAREAWDVFCMGIREMDHRVAAATSIAGLWDVQPEVVETQLRAHRPNFVPHHASVTVGRIQLQTLPQATSTGHQIPFVLTGHSLRLMEQLAATVATHEPTLLVGETGCGKTTLIQYLATSMGQTLVVQNLNVQSDSADLLGGYKPVDVYQLARPLYMDFVNLFSATFPSSANASFLHAIQSAFTAKQYKKMTQGMAKAITMADAKAKKQKLEASALTWAQFGAALAKFTRQHHQVETSFAFSFVEGMLVQAMKAGHWILLDEINLAGADTLERLASVLEGEHSGLSLTERGDVDVLKPHPNFRVFAAMNPPTDVGKKDLPPSLRNRFTQVYVDECVCPRDLTLLVTQQWKEMVGAPVAETVEFYLAARQMAIDVLNDGARQRPRYSLRTLTRSLLMTKTMLQRGYSLPRALYESFSMGFATQLDAPSRTLMMKTIKKTFAPNIKSRELDQAPPRPRKSDKDEYELVSSYWVPRGTLEPVDDAVADPTTNLKKFVLTPSVDQNLRHIARAVVIGKYPLLLQGPTSAGKTSLILYVAARLGQKCVRINNHEHTDIQEYLGAYVSDKDGKLSFQEGVLVQAVRHGWWIILDELNLAPSEVLEALNRLLDDNRELYIPETQTTITPHPRFMLFATQNPPGLYGGRKVLSRAFRNRFIELQVDEVPAKELQQILQERSALPPSFCTLLIDIMLDLQRVRAQSSVFAGKAGFITTRDLLRWAQRAPTTKQRVAEEGYFLLAERLRKDEDKLVVQEVLEKRCGVKIDLEALYNGVAATTTDVIGDIPPEVWGTPEQFAQVQAKLQDADAKGNHAGLSSISITSSLRRLFALVGRCLQHKEPVLLVGDTGCGKTTVCQLYSLLFDQTLHILNCHQHTETADFLGSLRPVRAKEQVLRQLQAALAALDGHVAAHYADAVDTGALRGDFNLATVGGIIDMLLPKVAAVASADDTHFAELHASILALKTKAVALFEWVDGPLVSSMKAGDLLLVDEINLADDAVLERLNSVLEPSRGLVLAEKGDSAEHITAAEPWRILATMNPGGDFGKRELSPALRNRFTEIWVPSLSRMDDLEIVIRDRLAPPTRHLADPVLAFVQQFNAKFATNGWKVTLRDLLSWLDFVRASGLDPPTAYVQGAALAVLDGLGLGSTQSLHAATTARTLAYGMLEAALPSTTATTPSMDWIDDGAMCGVEPFLIAKGPAPVVPQPFSLAAPTTLSNLHRVLRALQVPRPILLEGSPGVGKTSLIHALAQLSGHTLVRINLSEQTDVADLFGSDLPSTDADAASPFSWCDGVFLRALKAGHWVLLDELNLASQSVLEGLNACLDHRGTVYIPEIDQSFVCPKSFRVFAAQNPLRQGGGRKGLPKSFLNRFTRVVVDSLHDTDLRVIATALYPSIPAEAVHKMIAFNNDVHHATMVACSFGRHGAPWEFNLRDVFRWCTLIETFQAAPYDVAAFIPMLYALRFRTAADRATIATKRIEAFGAHGPAPPVFQLTPAYLQVGSAILPRVGAVAANLSALPPLLNQWLPPMEALMHCLHLQWPALLVGPSGSGKTSIVRLLAAMTGRKLHELGLSTGTDATELLGCFEQVDVQRRVQEAQHQLDDVVLLLQQRLLVAGNPTVLNAVAQAVAAVQQRQAAWKTHKGEMDPMIVDLLQQVLDTVRPHVVSAQTATVASIDDQLRSIRQLVASPARGSCFEWVDGALLRAMEQGDWLLLDNVNFCSASVLDRLNSLLEINGELLVNECGVVNGTLRVVKPHPDFRIFLAMDAQFGEVSRAMRNRCIEIALVPVDGAEGPKVDFCALVQGAASVPYPLAVYDRLHALHYAHAALDKSISLRHVVNWSQLVQSLVDHGTAFTDATEQATRAIYATSFEWTDAMVSSGDSGTGPVSTHLLVRDAVTGMHQRDARLPLYLASAPSQLLEWITLWTAAEVSDKWPRHLMLNDAGVWADCAEHGLRNATAALAEQLLPWALYRSGQPSGFHSASAHPFGAWLGSEVLLQSIVNGLSSAIRSVAPAPLTDLVVNPPALAVLKSKLQQQGDADAAAAQWQPIKALTQSLKMLQHMWWPRYQEHVLLGLTTTDASSSSKKTKRQLKRKKAGPATLLNVSYECFVHGAESVDVDNAIVPILYPFLHAFDAVLDECVQLTMYKVLSPASVAIVEKVVELRYALGRVFSQPADGPFPWHPFLVVWQWLLKAFASFETHVLALSTAVVHAKDMIERMEFAIGSVMGVSRAKDTLWKRGGHRQLPPSLQTWSAIAKVETLATTATGELVAQGHQQQVSLLDMLCTTSSVYAFTPSSLLSVPHAFRTELLHALTTYAWFIETANESFSTLAQLPTSLSARFAAMQATYAKEHEHMLVHLQPPDDDEDRGETKTVLLLSDDNSKVVEMWIQLQLSPLRELLYLRLEYQIVALLAELLVAPLATFPTKVPVVLRCIDKWLPLQRFVPTRSPVTLVPYQDILWRGHRYTDGDASLVLDDHAEYKRVLAKHMQSVFVSFHERLWSSSILHADKISNRVYHTEAQATVLSATGGLLRLHQAVETTLALHYLQPSKQTPIVDVTAATLKLQQAIAHWLDHHDCADLDALSGAYWWHLLSATVLVFCPEAAAALDVYAASKDAAPLLSVLATVKDARFQQSLPVLAACLRLSAALSAGSMAQQGMQWTLLGLWRFGLLTPTSPLDPALRPLIKRDVLLGQLAAASFRSTVDTVLHAQSPQAYAATDVDAIVAKVDALTDKAIARPCDDALFGAAFQEIVRFGTTIMTPKLVGWCEALAAGENGAHVLRELIMFQQTTESFVRRLQQKFDVFRDVTEPIVAAIYHTKDGLSLLMSVLQAQEKPVIASLARTLLSVPSPASLPATASALLDHGAVLDAHNVPLVDRLTTALYQLELQHTDQRQLFRTTAAASGVTLQVAQTIFDGYMQLWSENQAEMDKKREQEDQLFRFKARTLEIDSEEQILEREYRQQFPDFAKAFADLLEDPLTASPTDADPTVDAAPLPDAVIQLVAHAHERLFTQHARSPTSRAAAVQAMYEVGFHLKQSVNELRDERLDAATRGGHVVYAQQTLAQQAPASSVVFSQLSAAYVAGIDFHRDPHVKEVVMVRGPLQKFMLRVRALLQQWPDNAILQKLLLVANRLRQMSMHVPLAQILVGVELLLKHAQEWQAIASRDVSIADEIAALSGLVVRWRKLELYSWPQLMLIKERKYQLEARKAWFHLYTLLTSPPAADETVVAEVATLDWMFRAAAMPDTELLAKGWRFQLFDTMDAFLRTCTVGQFQTRLVLLYAFCGQLFMEATHSGALSTRRLASTLYHLYRFYAQHLTHGCHPLWARLRAPIQTQLNDFIKISKWDEQTYYSLAASAEKSHRKLMKFVRDYEEILDMPMQTFIDKVVDGNITNEKYDGIQALQTTWNDLKARDDPIELVADSENADDEDEDEDGDAPMADEPEPVKDAWRVVVMPAKASETAVFALPAEWASAVDGLRWVAQLPTLTRKIQKYTATELLADAALRRNQAGRHVGEELCETILYRIEKLKSESAPKGAKKKALVDLLAELKSQGFSYLKTRTPPQQQHMQSLLELDVPVVTNCLRLHQFVVRREALADVAGLWAHADSYYYRYLSQIQSMRFTVASGYNKDISWSEVDRMSGYAENMLHTMLQQRALLAQMTVAHEGLLFGLAQLSTLPAADDLVHAQRFLADWRDAQVDGLLRLTKWVDELRLLFPTEPVLDQLLSALQTAGATVARASVAAHSGIPEVPANDGNFEPSTSFGFQDKSASVATGFSPQLLQNAAVVWLDPAPLLAAASGIDAVVAQLAAFCENKTVVSIADALLTLQTEHQNWQAQADAHRASALAVDTSVVADVGATFNTLVEGILVSIQAACTHFEAAPTDDDASLVACHEHLVGLVNRSQVHKLPGQLAAVFALLQGQNATCVRPCLGWLQSLVPALQTLVQWHYQLLADVIYVHKSMAKCQFVIVRVFRTLLSNGFCKAPEEKEDDSTGGQFNFEDDVEGTGMGEGDGKKDVSDQIEDEEQLLGLKGDEPPPEQEKKDKEKDDSGLEMQNDFDGALEDVDDDDDNQDDDKDDDQEELDREMGDFDEDNVVDEKRWGEDSDDEEDQIDKDKEKFDDKEMEGEALEDEVRGKDDDDAGDDDDKDKKEPEKKDKPPAAADDDTPEAEGDDDKDKMPEDEINEDLEDKYEEDHDDIAPRDANPDDEESKPEEEEFADDMKLDGDGDDDKEADDPEIDEAMPEDETPEGDGTDETAAPEEDEPKEDETEEEMPDPVSMGAGVDDQEAPPEEQKDDTKLEEEVPEEVMPEDPTKDESHNAGAVAGLESKDGADAMEPEEVQDEEENADEEMADAEDTSEQKQDRQGGQANPDGKELQSVHSDVAADPQSRERKEPNPYQNPRKAQEHWRKRMEILDSDATKDQQPDAADTDDTADKQDDGGVGELADDDEKAELALAPTEDTVMHGADDDGDEEKPDEPMDDDAPVDAPEETPVADDKSRTDIDEDKDDKVPKAPQDKLKQSKDQGLKADELMDDIPDDNMQDSDDDARDDFERRIDEEVDEFAPVVASGADAGGESGLDRATSYDVDALRAQLDAAMQCPTVDSIERGTALWHTYDHLTRAGAQRLCEQLRLVLAPMLRSRLQGDYRTGKRINMRKVIPYIASSFRKDKIWLRRTKPSKRAYQVMVAIDDSESMADNHAGRLALEALTTLCKGMTQLEVGDISVVKFGAAVELLHPFDLPFTDDAGARVIRAFGFDQTKTHMVQTLEAIVGLLDQAKAQSHHHGSEITQIVFMISDGRFDKDGRTRMQKLVQHAMEKQQLIVLLIVDHPKDGQGICDTQSVAFVRGKVEMTPYMDNFPFPYYVIMKDTTLLPETLCNALRQWFELLQGSD